MWGGLSQDPNLYYVKIWTAHLGHHALRDGAAHGVGPHQNLGLIQLLPGEEVLGHEILVSKFEE